MKWLVAVDLARSSAGAIALANWTQSQHGDEAAGLHVMQLPIAATPEWADAVAGKLDQQLSAYLEALHVPESLPARVAQAEDTEQALIEARAAMGADGLILGRRARSDQAALIRLGAVARHMLRLMPSPLIICPPELDMTTRTGPVVLATDGSSKTTGAAERFARNLAQHWQRPLVACHVAPFVEDYASAYFLNGSALHSAQQALLESGSRLMNNWLAKSQDPPPDEVCVLQGPCNNQLRQFAHDRAASMLVLGSRMLGGPERWFSGSTGMALAAHADCPVAIVPPA